MRPGSDTPVRLRGVTKRYTISTAILRELSRLDFATFADIGGAEGYKAALVRELFGAQVMSCDLSAEACQRAREIFGVEARPIDIHALPFEDDAFDVVLCSETLEHVPQIERATRELLRVARRAVVITVPCEPPAVIERNLREQIPHAHIHALHLRSFDWAHELGYEVRAQKLLSPLLYAPGVLVDATPRPSRSLLARSYRALCPLLRATLGARCAAWVADLDRVATRLGPHGGMLVTLLKDPACALPAPRRTVRARDVVRFAVPWHRVPSAAPASSRVEVTAELQPA